MRNKKIQILLVFVLAIGLFGLLFYWRYGEKKQMESLNGLQETYKEYDKKIREIRNDMENKKAEVNDIEKPANVILAFSEEDQELMEKVRKFSWEAVEDNRSFLLRKDARCSWKLLTNG